MLWCQWSLCKLGFCENTHSFNQLKFNTNVSAKGNVRDYFGKLIFTVALQQYLNITQLLYMFVQSTRVLWLDYDYFISIQIHTGYTFSCLHPPVCQKGMCASTEHTYIRNWILSSAVCVFLCPCFCTLTQISNASVGLHEHTWGWFYVRKHRCNFCMAIYVFSLSCVLPPAAD